MNNIRTHELANDLGEPIIEPDLPIVDAHHHLIIRSQAQIQEMSSPNHPFGPDWSRMAPSALSKMTRYLLDELVEDVTSGHNIRATVFVDSHVMYRKDGPEPMKPVGEVEFVNGMAAVGASGIFGNTKVCAGIVSNADLRLGDAVEEVLEAQLRAGGGRFRGVRNRTLYDPDKGGALGVSAAIPPGVLLDSAFRAGFRKLQNFGLSLDVTVYEPQLPDVIDLARAFPEASIILCHMGLPLGISSYTGKRAERFPIWRDNMRALASCANVSVKLGDNSSTSGFPSYCSNPPATSTQIASELKPYVETCIELFGANRCMFESNFPERAASSTYPVLWNAFKRITSGCSQEEKTALFSGTATRVYRLDI